MAAQVRKVQISKSGLYVTIPVQICKLLRLRGKELLKFYVDDNNRVVIDVIEISK